MTPAEFKAARLRLGFTQVQMGVALGYTDGQPISKIERGEMRPGKAVLLLLERMMEDAK